MYSIQLKRVVLLLTLLTISGCSLWGKKDAPIVEVRTIEVKVPIVHPVLPRAINLKEPYFHVVSRVNLDEFIEDFEKRNDVLVFTAMSIGDYELMAYNMQEIKRYIDQLKEVIVYYRKINDDEGVKSGEAK